MVRRLLFAAALVFSPVIAQAQVPAGVHPAYVRAQTLVNDGDATAGRALVDSMIAIAPPGSNAYAEGVYWRAVLASTAADAEMDYRRIVVDFPLSPRVEDALIRLAQLEIARANYDGALRHLNRLINEHPQSPSRARAGYWMARALFDKNDVQGGCTATAEALARTSEGDAELRNQITYLNQRCAGVVLAGPATSPAVTPAPAVTTTVPVTTPPPAPPSSVPATTPARATAPPPVPPAAARPAEKVPAPVTTPAAGTARAWSVQVAAYNARSQADAMVARLKTNGYEARVDGSAAPFRVRIGRYTTQGQASAVQRSLKAKNIEGFVVQADTR
ncbi:MAG: SPOR domain-containing protein [Gemmatimonadaceae bacterium]